MSSRSKSNPRSMCSTKKHITESCVKQVDGEVQKLKAQKVTHLVADNVKNCSVLTFMSCDYFFQVKLQCKIKLDSMQFRLSKASLEKETLQVKPRDAPFRDCLSAL